MISNKGFSLKKIASSFEFSEKWNIEELSLERKKQLENIFSQPFSYLASGAECYAFISEDRKYVLKFFLTKHLTPKNWLKFFPIPGMKNYRLRKIERRKARQQELFSSYKIAYEELQDETGVQFIHLNTHTHQFNKNILLIDKKGIKHLLPMDDYAFVLQDKVEMLTDHFAWLIREKRIDEAKIAIQALFAHVIEVCKKGVIDQDSGINHNYGFLQGKVVHFDVGRISYDERAKQPSYYLKEVSRFSKKLKRWFSENYPEALAELKTELEPGTTWVVPHSDSHIAS